MYFSENLWETSGWDNRESLRAREKRRETTRSFSWRENSLTSFPREWQGKPRWQAKEKPADSINYYFLHPTWRLRPVCFSLYNPSSRPRKSEDIKKLIHNGLWTELWAWYLVLVWLDYGYSVCWHRRSPELFKDKEETIPERGALFTESSDTLERRKAFANVYNTAWRYHWWLQFRTSGCTWQWTKFL